jgi:signal transduction histidine kinase
MSTRFSLRARVLIGAALWTAGLLVTVCILGIVVLMHLPVQHMFVLRAFATYPLIALVVACLCMVLGFWQVKRGLSTLDQLRTQLAAVRDGTAYQVAGEYPSEVAPLVADLNELLEHRDHAIRRAVAKAGDLAHGLKTPLAVLAQEASRARAAGQCELATSIEYEIDRMRRQVDYHLAQARAAASGATPGARCTVGESAESLARTLLRLHADRGIAIEVRVPAAHAFRGQREDLDEMLGNLLDNACKWSRSRVVVASAAAGATVVVSVDDDGPGLEPSMRDAVLQRGVRVDEAAPGSGLGLAIVRDLAELYGGSVALTESALGGVCARLTLPA